MTLVNRYKHSVDKDKGWSFFIHSVYANNIELVKYLISSGVDVNRLTKNRKENALFWAVHMRHYELLGYLVLKTHINVNQLNYINKTPLMVAIAKQDVLATSILLKSPKLNFSVIGANFGYVENSGYLGYTARFTALQYAKRISFEKGSKLILSEIKKRKERVMNGQRVRVFSF